MAALQGYLKWGLCPQTPGIFIEGINVSRGHFYFARKGTFLLCSNTLFASLLHSCRIFIALMAAPRQYIYRLKGDAIHSLTKPPTNLIIKKYTAMDWNMKKTVLTLMLLSSVCWGEAVAGQMSTTSQTQTFMGFYVGANGGYAFANTKNLNTSSRNIQYCTDTQGCFQGNIISSISATGASNSFSFSNSSFFTGGQVGYNRKVYKDYIVGLESDIQGFAKRNQSHYSSSNVNFAINGISQSISTNFITSKDINFIGSFRGKLGYLVRSNVFIYGTGGLAYGSVSSKTIVQQNYGVPDIQGGVAPNWSSAGKYSNTRIGFSLGGALEWMFRTNLSAKIEYLYYNLGNVTYNSSNLIDVITVPHTPQNFFTNTMSSTTRFDGNVLRLGLNYHFA